MKAILGSLLCLVLFASECFALKGGPPYPGAGAASIGRYAGVLTADGSSTSSFNSLGIFTLSVPAIGAATGDVIIFTNGVYFLGTIQGIVQPNAQLSALATASQTGTKTEVNSDGTITTVTTIVSVLDGEITAKIVPSRSFVSVLLVKGSAAFSQHDPDQTAGTPDRFFTVAGFKQSNTP
jgi:hypothetical protein